MVHIDIVYFKSNVLTILNMFPWLKKYIYIYSIPGRRTFEIKTISATMLVEHDSTEDEKWSIHHWIKASQETRSPMISLCLESHIPNHWGEVLSFPSFLVKRWRKKIKNNDINSITLHSYMVFEFFIRSAFRFGKWQRTI